MSQIRRHLLRSFRSKGSPSRADRSHGYRPRLEALEDRAVPSVTSVVMDGMLTVSSDAGDAIVITEAGGNVKINGADPNTGAAAASSLTKMIVNGDSLGNFIDVTGVSLTNFPALDTLQVSAGGGNDTVRMGTAGIAAQTSFDLGAGTGDYFVITGGSAHDVVRSTSEAGV